MGPNDLLMSFTDTISFRISAPPAGMVEIGFIVTFLPLSVNESNETFELDDCRSAISNKLLKIRKRKRLRFQPQPYFLLFLFCTQCIFLMERIVLTVKCLSIAANALQDRMTIHIVIGSFHDAAGNIGTMVTDTLQVGKQI